MADELDGASDKIGKRIATFVIREATERGMHPMDFAEVFADALMTCVMARMVPQTREPESGGGC